MPKTNTKRDLSYASKSYLSRPESPPESESYAGMDSVQTRKSSKGADPRNIVGDQGVQKLMRKGRGVASPSSPQLTPNEMAERKAKEAADEEEFSQGLYNSVKKAMTKKGGSQMRSNYE